MYFWPIVFLWIYFPVCPLSCEECSVPTQWEPWPWKTRARGRGEPLPALFEQSLELQRKHRDGEPTGSVKEPAAPAIRLPATSSLEGSYCVVSTLSPHWAASLFGVHEKLQGGN